MAKVKEGFCAPLFFPWKVFVEKAGEKIGVLNSGLC
jgi:hypothetical protein